MDNNEAYRAGIDAALWDERFSPSDERDLNAIAASLTRIIKMRDAVRAESRPRRRVRELLNAGISQPEIAQKLGVSRQGVNRHVRLGHMQR